MRLHLGCGRQHLPGALNLDRYDTAVADIKADVRGLPVQTGCSSSVVAHHLLEHLSYTEALYGLAEWYRVLAPDGLIEIETPDPGRSFEAFLDSSDDRQSAVALTWIFGEERAGQGHRALFPPELLSKIVIEAGFDRLEFSEPRTHLHRWGIRMTARKDSSNAAANLLSSLRPVIAFDVMERAVPGEALELESALWTPLRRAIDNTLTPEEKKACLLKAAVTAPQVVSALTGCCPGVFGVDGDHKNWGKLARALIAAEVCAVLRKAFLALSSSINQASDGYEHLVSAACRVARKWIDTPPENPVRELPLGLSESGIGLRPSPNEGFIRDFDIATGKEPVDGRTPAWPEHALFTRSHLAERACWFRDVGIRCFGLGEHETARRLFRLAINSKLEGVYSVWNMARLQTALRHFDNAEAFYRAALDFPMPPALKQTIQTELEGCRSDDISLRGPVPPGAGQDRAEEMPVESTSERRG